MRCFVVVAVVVIARQEVLPTDFFNNRKKMFPMSITILQARSNKDEFSAPYPTADLPNRNFDLQTSGDADLKRRVTTFLAERHRPALRHIEVQAEQGTVTLRGKVETFHEKQLSAQLARRVAGVVRLVDEVIVGSNAHDSKRKPTSHNPKRFRSEVSLSDSHTI